MILAQTPNSVQQMFGTIKPPVPQALTDPGAGFSQLMATAIRLVLFVGGLMLLGYLFYGAFLYITSGGDEEKTVKARQTMTYAVIGVILLIVGLAIFSLVAGDILGIIKRDAAGNIFFNLPTVGGNSQCLGSGAYASSASQCCSGNLNSAGAGGPQCF